MQIFISYAHKDQKAFLDLQTHLKPLTRGDQGIVAWSDRDIKTGDVWRDEIRQAVYSSSVAILLISHHFLASDFIINEELAPLFKRHEKGEITILCVILGHCAFLSDRRLSRLQALPSPDKPISGLARAKKDEAYEAIRKRVEALANLRLSAGKVEVAGTPPETRRATSKTPRTHYQDETVDLLPVYLSHRSFRDADGYTVGLKFERCVIRGPCVVVPDQCEIVRARFENTVTRRADSFILFPPKGEAYITGGLFLRNSRFIDCTFQLVGFAHLARQRIADLLADSDLEFSEQAE